MSNRSSILSREDFRDIVSRFPLHGALLDARPYGNGHINDTFVASFDHCGIPVRYILQRINHRIFKNVPGLMENIDRVTSHLALKSGDDSRRALTLIRTLDGNPFLKTTTGDYWRAYLFVEGAQTHDSVRVPEQAYEAALAFGRFQQALVDLPGGRLHETIPHFHDTSKRFEALMDASRADVAGRREEALVELEFAFERKADTARLWNLVNEGKIPERVTHNDTKLNNVMLDEKTGEAVCVIDLDTVMPGLSLHDFGDMARFATNTAVEDEADLSKVDVSLPVFEKLVEGYSAGVGDILTEVEWNNLVFAAKIMTYEVGIRFLTDYLQGDVYFKTKHPRHNLDRARNQLRLVERMETAAHAMSEIVSKQLKSRRG